VDLLKILVAYSADVDLRNYDGETAVHRAVLAGELGSVRTLASLGAKLNLADEEGRTPLYSALMCHSDTQAIPAALLVS
jgi:ankyrin repeat protein